MGVEYSDAQVVGDALDIMSQDVLNVVVTCTKQKRFPVAKNLCLGAVAKGTVGSRFANWKSRLLCSGEEKCRVADLYAGDHWSTVLGFRSSSFKVKVWVASAGYGLIDLSDRVVPYAATFSKSNADSVFNKVPKQEYADASRVWWQELTKWRITNHCRSLTGLARSRSSEPLLVVASENYLRAIESDLVEAVDCLDSRNQLSILSTGCKALGGLSDCLLPGDARLQHLVGGALRSLNTRVASRLLRDASVESGFRAFKRQLDIMMKDLPDLPKFDRKPVTDDVVAQFILGELSVDSSLAHTPLLRRFRDRGHACEQSRFRSLYNKIKMEIS